MRRDSDEHWSMTAPTERATIAVLEPSADTLERHRQRLAAPNAERVPFGFARALMPRGLCGVPRQGRPHLGGCVLAVGHREQAHRWRPADPAPIRPGVEPV